MARKSRQSLAAIMEAAAERQAQIEEDVEWLDRQGVHPEWWPQRVGTPSLSALEKRMRGNPVIRQKIQRAMSHAGVRP